MEIYLDANATTPVLAQARDAALAAMADAFGNPSSSHATGVKARALLDSVRACARRVLGVGNGQLVFTSGATEGIQTAVLSALASLRAPAAGAGPAPELLLYGATEHKAVPEALRHWNALLGLGLQVLAIPVGRDGRHDLGWLQAHAARAGLVCTMAANNETGVTSDLDGIANALAGSPALWLVDSVQSLGKQSLNLARTRIDYAPFSGHKACAPKGIGMLYVRAGAPLTALLAGGGQEDALRSGTENMPGIAALGAVLAALEAGGVFRDRCTLEVFRDRLSAALQSALPGLVFNAPPAISLPSTLNFSVPGLSSALLLNLFDAAGVRVSGGSACSAAKAEPSHVLAAMGLPAWQAASAIRLSFAPTADAGFIEQACERIRACGEALRRSGPGAPGQGSLRSPLPTPDRETHFASLPGAPTEAAHSADALCCDLTAAALQAMLQARPEMRLVDVREPYEQAWGGLAGLLGLDQAAAARCQSVPLSDLADALPGWLALPADSPVLFFCRSGKRSAQAATLLRRQGHQQAWSLAGGLALLPHPDVEPLEIAP